MGWISDALGGIGDIFGVGDILGGIGGGLDYAQQRKDAKKADMRAYNQALSMSNTAHQREVADLRAAGLNPVLSAMGSGASSPVVPVHTPAPSGSSAIARRQLEQQEKVNESIIEKNQADANKANAEAERTRARWDWGDLISPDNARKVIEHIVNDGFSAQSLPGLARQLFGLSPGKPMASAGVSSAASVPKSLPRRVVVPLDVGRMSPSENEKYNSIIKKRAEAKGWNFGPKKSVLHP